MNTDKGDTVWDKQWRFQNKKIKPLLESHGWKMKKKKKTDELNNTRK